MFPGEVQEAGAVQVIALMNMKGGVGKTTLAVNIGYSLAYFFGKKVLLVDVDPQFNATQSLIGNQAYLEHTNAERPTVLDIFLPNRPGAVRTLSGTASGGKNTSSLNEYLINVSSDLASGGRLDVIPSRLSLLEVQESQRQTEVLLKRFVNEKAQGYDYVLLDCPPTISVFSQAAFLAADKYLVPLKPDPLSVIGLPLLERWLSDYANITGHNISKVGLVFTMVRNPHPAQMQDVMRQIRHERKGEVFNAMLSQSTLVASSVAPKPPSVVQKPRSNAAREIRAIAQEFLTRLAA